MSTAGNSKAITRLLLHLHPNKVNEQSIKFTRTFGLGGMAALLFVILGITGLLLRFAYVPTVVGAYDSLVELQTNVVFGKVLRNLHYWSGMLLVMISFLHVIRVFYSQSLYHERRKNWIYGLVLLVIVIFSNFTGYLLPWDQLSFWAVTIMTNMLDYVPFVGHGLADLVRGGREVSETTLLRFYNLHTGMMPLLMVFLLSVHFWLVRKVKGIAVQDNKQKNLVPSNPNLVYKEIFVALLLVVVLVLFSMLVDAPLKAKADPLISPNPSKAPWYFMGFQELLLHIHPGFGVFVIPLLVGTYLVIIPYLRYEHLNIGQWFNSREGKRLTIISFGFGVVLTLAVIFTSEFFLDLRQWMPYVPVWISNGVLLLLLYAIPVAAYLYFVKSKYNAGKIELIMALFTLIVTAYIVMTVVGSWFRGEGMQLLI